MSNRVDDLFVGGTLVAKSFTAPKASIGNDAIASGDPIAGVKLQRGISQVIAQDSDAVAAAQTRTVHVAVAAGSIQQVSAGCISPCVGDAVITMDVLKNGASILTAAIDITSAQAARALVDATVATTDYAANDVFEISITVSAGTGTLGSGVFVLFAAFEYPQ